MRTSSNITGEVKNANTSVVYSKYGDITIENDSTANINGLIYAPLGTLTINSPNVNLNGVIIADKIVINGGSVNINYKDDIAQFIGNESEVYDFSDLIYLPEDWLGDTDKDELFDIYEKVIDTDPLNPDTDGDGLPDGYEVLTLNTDPLEVDTDENDISDADEDFDSDNLNNLGEYQNKTEPYNPDTDDDGFLDGDEINKYKTDPLNPDTDDDGLLDGEESYNGSIYEKYGMYFDPLNPDTNGNGILDGDEVFGQSKQQEVSTHDEAITEIKVDMTTNGNLERNLTVESMYNIDAMSTNVYSLIGEPFNFTSATDFESATITFKVDKSKLGDTKFDNLLILWYDEENQIFKEMETIHDEANSTVSTTTTHFSQYMIVDSEKWYANWEASFNELRKMWIGNTSYQRNMHTIFMVDCSSSMRRTDYSSPVLVVGYKGVTEENIETIRDKINGNADISAYCVNWCKRARICHNIINNKGGNDTAAIIRFSNTVISDSGLSYNKSYLNDQLPNINNGSGTANLNNALNTVLSHVETDTTDIYRLVVITDNNINFGQISSSDFPGNVILNIVNLGSNDIGYGLKEVAHATGGDVYDVASASDLTYESGGMVYVPPKFIGEDYDEDGIPDLVELYSLKPNGQPINTSMYLKDTDGDGVWDNKAPLPNDYGISCNLKASDRNSLLSEIDSQISADIYLVRWGFQLPYNSVSDCIDIIYDYDNVITKLSNKYMIPKAAIQAVLLRELKCFWAQDDFSDSCVLSYYAYQYQVEYYNSLEWWQQILIQYPEYSIMSREDASTGYGQIYALTAINANNWAIEEGIISGNKYDYDDWHQREEIWNKLRTDNTYNISMIPLVLMHGASKKGFDRNYYNYTVEQIKKMLAVYNGDDSYGEAVYHSYVIFDKYN